MYAPIVDKDTGAHTYACAIGISQDLDPIVTIRKQDGTSYTSKIVNETSLKQLIKAECFK